MATRAQIIEQARTYLGTPFQHMARHRGVGLDCVGIVLCVGEELGFLDTHGVPFTRHAYPYYDRQPPPGQVMKELRAHMVEKRMDQLSIGDVVALRVPFDPCHTAIITRMEPKMYMIHSYNSGLEKVVEHIVDARWKRRMVAVFEFPGVED